MGNLKSWAGPVSEAYQERTRALQRQILAKARALGMTPVLPSFSGFVPDAYSAHNPGADVRQTDGGWGRDFGPVSYVDPTSPDFAAISATFVSLYCEEFGCNEDAPNYYAADLYNELSPPTNDTAYLASASAGVFSALQAADPRAVWVTQGWMFHIDQGFWQPEQVKAFVTGPPRGSLVVIDLFAENNPIWADTDSFYDTPFIFSTIFNVRARGTPKKGR
jgi:alpha-N-acetylglucosaminidase